jgi:hypothetical protein
MNAPSSTDGRFPRDPDPIAPERQAYVTASRAQLPRGQYILDQSLAPIRAARALDGPRRRILRDAECRGNATTDTCASPSVWPEAVTTIVQGEIDAIASMFGGRVRTVPATTKTAWSSRASSIVSGRAPGALTISSVMGSFPTGCRDGKSSSSRSPSRRTISVPLMLWKTTCSSSGCRSRKNDGGGRQCCVPAEVDLLGRGEPAQLIVDFRIIIHRLEEGRLGEVILHRDALQRLIRQPGIEQAGGGGLPPKT